MRSFGRGAESEMFACTLFGIAAVAKVREPKRYRINALDDELRWSRTRREAKILSVLAKHGVPVPALLGVGKDTIYMERLDGVLLRDTRKGPVFYSRLGGIVRDMHNAGVVHGDMTPANVMIAKGNIYIIDFGLAEIANSVEEKALDILLMKRSADKRSYAGFLRGYSSDNKNFEQVTKRLADIEKRGRYQVRTLE